MFLNYHTCWPFISQQNNPEDSSQCYKCQNIHEYKRKVILYTIGGNKGLVSLFINFLINLFTLVFVLFVAVFFCMGELRQRTRLHCAVVKNGSSLSGEKTTTQYIQNHRRIFMGGKTVQCILGALRCDR